MRRGLAILALAVLPVAAAAGILGSDRNLGAHPAMPEDLGLLDGRLAVGARVIDAATGAPALDSRPGQVLRFEAGFLPREPLAAGAVRLECSVRFRGPGGTAGEPVVTSPCFDGAEALAKGTWTELSAGFEFQPGPDDAPGAHGVEITVVDAVSGQRLVLMPTYGVGGGAP